MNNKLQSPDTAPPALSQTVQALPDSGQERQISPTLRALGADTYDLWLPETRSLDRFLTPDEIIEGVVYGWYHLQSGRPPGRGLLVATKHRLILIDHKPLFLHASEISYEGVRGISCGSTGFVSTVTLSTRMGEVGIRTFNRHVTIIFVNAVEAHLFNKPAEFRPLTEYS